MSASGHKQTFATQNGMSALPQKRTCAVQLGTSALCQKHIVIPLPHRSANNSFALNVSRLAAT